MRSVGMAVGRLTDRLVSQSSVCTQNRSEVLVTKRRKLKGQAFWQAQLEKADQLQNDGYELEAIAAEQLGLHDCCIPPGV